MKKVVINTIHGGFSLSPLAIKKYLELNGQSCYFFRQDMINGSLFPLSLEEAEKETFIAAFTEPNPEAHLDLNKKWEDFTDDEREEYVRTWNALTFCSHQVERDDEQLVSIVEELQEKANGPYARLKVVEIPEDVDWEIQEYDGVEWIAEKHRTWN